MIGKCNTGGENVTPEVTTQTPIIQNITEALVGKAQGATATADKILEGYSAYVGGVLVDGTLTKSGMYVWKKLTVQGGDFVDFVVSDSETAYPDGGTQDGYWYEKFSLDLSILGITKIAVDEFTFSSETSGSTALSHSLGKIPKMAFLFANSTVSKGNDNRIVQSMHISKLGAGTIDIYRSEEIYWYDGSSTQTTGLNDLTESSVKHRGGGKYQAGIKYTLVTMA